jgi:uncharacterized protein with PQ loop repeat
VVTFGVLSAPLAGFLGILRTRDASSIYFPLALATLTNSTLWLSYGIAIRDVYISLPNVFGVILACAQIGLKVAFTPMDKLFAPAVVAGGKGGAAAAAVGKYPFKNSGSPGSLEGAGAGVGYGRVQSEMQHMLSGVESLDLRDGRTPLEGRAGDVEATGEGQHLLGGGGGGGARERGAQSALTKGDRSYNTSVLPLEH